MGRAGWLFVGLWGLFGCGSSDEPPVEIYYLVTHGPTTDVGFWGEVLAAADELAADLGITVEPLHPVVEASGEELNAQMQQAIDARPAGIVATVWGTGMAEKVKEANQLGIPVVAINVYPDPAEYVSLALDGSRPDERAGLLLYSGQNDALAAVDVTRALVCGAGVERTFDGESCEGIPLDEAWASLTLDTSVRAVCIVHQQSAGVLTRCAEMERVLVEDFALPATAFDRVGWSEAVPNAGVQAMEAYFADPALDDVDRFLVLANGTNGAEAYLDADLGNQVRPRVFMGTFDTSPAICAALVDGRIAFASSQGHREQARQGLAYLHHYVHHEHDLPVVGQAPDGSAEPRWTTSPEGYRWFRTGPELLGSCPESKFGARGD